MTNPPVLDWLVMAPATVKLLARGSKVAVTPLSTNTVRLLLSETVEAFACSVLVPVNTILISGAPGAGTEPNKLVPRLPSAAIDNVPLLINVPPA